MKKVFTFWEPKEAMPGYVKLCLETWRSCLPEHEVVVLDYRSLGDYLTAREQAAVLWKGMTFAMQSDCIRCAVLKRHGGIWLDADTVLTRPLDARFRQADVTMVARRMNGALVNYGAFIQATRPEAKFLCDWHTELTVRVDRARRLRDRFWFGVFHRRARRLMCRWDYCVNAIIDPLAARAAATDYAWVDRDAAGALPEERLLTGADGEDISEIYRDFWFGPGDPAEALDGCAGILMLHNSWTPPEFLALPAGEFLRTDTRLAALLRSLQTPHSTDGTLF